MFDLASAIRFPVYPKSCFSPGEETVAPKWLKTAAVVAVAAGIVLLGLAAFGVLGGIGGMFCALGVLGLWAGLGMMTYKKVAESRNRDIPRIAQAKENQEKEWESKKKKNCIECDLIPPALREYHCGVTEYFSSPAWKGLGHKSQIFEDVKKRLDRVPAIAWASPWIYEQAQIEFEEALRKHPENPYAQREVIDSFDKFLKISFAISHLALKTSLEKEENGRQELSLDFCLKPYSMIWNGLHYQPKTDTLGYLKDEFALREHQSRFSTKDTVQNQWKLLMDIWKDEQEAHRQKHLGIDSDLRCKSMLDG